MTIRRLSALIEEGARDIDDLFFIQIGSHSGTAGDPLRPLILKYRWSGILVEPVRHLFDQLVQNYRQAKNLKFENVAISDTQEKRPFYRLAGNLSGLPDWADQLGSFYREVIESHRDLIANIEEYLTVEDVECIPLATIVERHDVRRLDLLHTDAEGADWLILRQVDSLAFKPVIVVYEHKHLSGTDRCNGIQFLEQRGYSLIQGRSDTLAVLCAPGNASPARAATCDDLRENMDKCIDFRPRPVVASKNAE